jgi:hypothetical protein
MVLSSKPTFLPCRDIHDSEAHSYSSISDFPRSYSLNFRPTRKVITKSNDNGGLADARFAGQKEHLQFVIGFWEGYQRALKPSPRK